MKRATITRTNITLKGALVAVALSLLSLANPAFATGMPKVSSLEEAMALAATDGRHILLDFYTVW